MISRLEKAIFRVLKAEKKERTEEDDKRLKEQKALYGKDAGKIRLPSQYPFARIEQGDDACKVEISRPCCSELEAQTKCTTYMIFAFIQN